MDQFGAVLVVWRLGGRLIVVGQRHPGRGDRQPGHSGGAGDDDGSRRLPPPASSVGVIVSVPVPLDELAEMVIVDSVVAV